MPTETKWQKPLAKPSKLDGAGAGKQGYLTPPTLLVYYEGNKSVENKYIRA